MNAFLTGVGLAVGLAVLAYLITGNMELTSAMNTAGPATRL